MARSNTYAQYSVAVCFFVCVMLIDCCIAHEHHHLHTKKFVPPGMNPEMFPEPDYDTQAPECTPFREPCGFYSFSLHGKTPFKWVKSWCRCATNQECVYDRTDMKMRLYRQMCVPREKLESDNEDYDRKYFYI